MGQETASRGAFGLRFAGVDETADSVQVVAPHGWPTMQVTVREGRIDRGRSWIGDEDAYVCGVASSTHLRREPLAADLTMRRVHHAAELIQPFLGVAAAIASRWLGRTAFHAGAFVDDNGHGIGVLGSKGAGKSTLLGMLAHAGAPVLTDDLLVIDCGTAFAGARCVDLRRDAAAAFGIGVPLGVVGARERWRVSLPPITPDAMLRGWVVPEWGDRVELVTVPLAQRLSLLVSHLALVIEPPSPHELLDLAALPCWRFVRPQRWDTASEIVPMLRMLPTLPSR